LQAFDQPGSSRSKASTKRPLAGAKAKEDVETRTVALLNSAGPSITKPYHHHQSPLFYFAESACPSFLKPLASQEEIYGGDFGSWFLGYLSSSCFGPRVAAWRPSAVAWSFAARNASVRKIFSRQCSAMRRDLWGGTFCRGLQIKKRRV
jgi:hypothetical protein